MPIIFPEYRNSIQLGQHLLDFFDHLRVCRSDLQKRRQSHTNHIDTPISAGIKNEMIRLLREDYKSARVHGEAKRYKLKVFQIIYTRGGALNKGEERVMEALQTCSRQ